MKQIKTKLNFSILSNDGKIYPQQVNLKVKLKIDNIQGLTFQEWIQRLISNKLIITTNDNKPEIVSTLEPYFVGIFVSNDISLDYLFNHIEFILKSLINENLIEFIFE